MHRQARQRFAARLKARLEARLRKRDDAGVSLVEVLMALAILSIAAVAILAGLQLSVATSDIQRKQTTSGTYVRNYAEAIQAKALTTSGFQSGCLAGADSLYKPASGFYEPPSGFTAAVTRVEALKGDGTADASCPAGSPKRVTVQVASDDTRATEYLTFVVRKP